MDIKAVGIRLKFLRESAGLTYERLASKSGVAENTLLSIEKGRGNPTVKTLAALADALDVPMAALFDLVNGGPMPAEALRAKGRKRTREAKPLRSPDDLLAGLELLSKFAAQSRDIQVAVMALVYEDTNYLSQLSPEFRAQLARLLLVAKT